MKALDIIWHPGFQQTLYRKLLFAMSRPGIIVELENKENSFRAVRGILSTLVDNSVSLCDPHSLLTDSDQGMLNAKNASAKDADFILVDGNGHPEFQPKTGTLDSPDFSATLIVEVKGFSAGSKLRLKGPGIDDTETLMIDGLNREWILKRSTWVAHFPLGIDMIFADKNRLMALPRTTKVEID